MRRAWPGGGRIIPFRRAALASRAALGTLLAVAAGALVLLAAWAPATGAIPGPRAQAVLLETPAGAVMAAGAAAGERSVDEGAAQAAGARVEAASVLAEASAADAASPAAGARAVARSVSLLDGLVTAREVRRSVQATPDGSRHAGVVRGLRIAGADVGDVGTGRSFELPDGAGTVSVNVGGRGLEVMLDAPTAGLPAGTVLTVASVGASAPSVRASEPEPPAEHSARSPGSSPPPRGKAPAPEASRRRRDDTDPAAGRAAEDTPTAEPRRREATARQSAIARLTGEGFSFPVHGEASISDGFGAPRPQGAHQGNDVFAEFGAPVLAVADGTVERVGTLPISGNRLWLRTTAGDAFFYAHLSAFAPAAVDGRRVRAGELLGFVGNTGDAEPTPPHVHFEIHPRGGPAIDPYEILVAWQRQGMVRRDSWTSRHGADARPRPGALVPVRDFIAD